MLKRREFLVAAAGGLYGAAASRIVDTHVHFYDPRRLQGVPWPPKDDAVLYRPVLPAEYARLVQPLGVSGTIVVEASSWVEDNQWVLDLAKENPVIVGVVGNLQSDGFARNLERFARNPLFLGIRRNGTAIARNLANPEDFRRLADAGLTLDAIGNAAMPAALVALSDKVPELRISINHMPVEPGGWATNESARVAIRELAKRPQVYAKVSGVLRAGADPASYTASLDEVWNLFGADRVMYGSNWPVSARLAPYATVLDVVRRWIAGKGPEASEKYFRRNSQACYRWQRSGVDSLLP